MADYNADLQPRLLASGATHASLAGAEGVPTLELLASAYGEETPEEWLVIQLGGLSDFAEVRTKMSSAQIRELARLVLAAYGWLNAAEVHFFLARFKLGLYGRFYAAVDPMRVTTALLDYVQERRAALERAADRRRREHGGQGAARGVTHAEYLRLKARADGGDPEARRLLARPGTENKNETPKTTGT